MSLIDIHCQQLSGLHDSLSTRLPKPTQYMQQLQSVRNKGGKNSQPLNPHGVFLCDLGELWTRPHLLVDQRYADQLNKGSETN